jgi:hypothetical protein
MTLKADGTNGILQQYDYQVLTTGFTYTFAAGTTVLVINPAGTLATGTITFPAAPVDGMTVTFSSTQQITALTLAGNSKTIVSAVTFLPANQSTTYVYRLSNTTWYPMATVAGTGSQLISGVAQASTSGTSIDFTSIPSWVKRITVMMNGVSWSTTTPYLRIQLGSGSVETSGYSSALTQINSASAASWQTSPTAGFDVAAMGAATDTVQGSVIFSLLGSNTWICSSVVFRASGAGTQSINQIAGSKTTAGALDRLRITTSNGTDTFDAGTINILYE